MLEMLIFFWKKSIDDRIFNCYLKYYWSRLLVIKVILFYIIGVLFNIIFVYHFYLLNNLMNLFILLAFKMFKLFF